MGRGPGSRRRGCKVPATTRKPARGRQAQVRGSEFAGARGKGARAPASSRGPQAAPLPPTFPEGPRPYSPRSSQRPPRLRAMARRRAGPPARTEAPGAGAGSGGARLAPPTAAPEGVGGGGGQVAGAQRGGPAPAGRARGGGRPRGEQPTPRAASSGSRDPPLGRARGLSCSVPPTRFHAREGLLDGAPQAQPGHHPLPLPRFRALLPRGSPLRKVKTSFLHLALPQGVGTADSRGIQPVPELGETLTNPQRTHGEELEYMLRPAV